VKVKLARTAGFCMGVRRAMEIVLAETNKKSEGPLFTFGPLIHNNQVLDLLASKGVRPVDDLNGLETGVIVIRAHGVPPQQREAIRNTGLKTIDATCPKVLRVQAIIRAHTKKGYSAIIVGDENHPEVIGLMGYAEGPVHVIKAVKDISGLPHIDKLFIVAQTTQNQENFGRVVKALKERFPDVLVFDTICDATRERQEEVRSFAGHVNAVVVVGGYHSGNTQRLVQISKEAGLPTFHVETEKELDKEKLAEMDVTGVTSGASTPNWMIKNVVKEIEGIRGGTESPLSRTIRRTLKFLVLSNLLVASGAFAFAYAAAILSERTADLASPVLTFLYIYAMHVLNRFLDKGASAYNDPERAAFLKKHRFLLIITGIGAIIAGLALAHSIGMVTFIAVSVVSLFGIIYSLPLIPEKFQDKYPYAKIKDIPGSRSLSESLAWVTLITVLPLLELGSIVWPAAIISILAVFLMGYVRSALFDLFQVQGDLIVGTETLPIVLGEQRTLSLLKLILLTTGIILAVSPLFGLAGPFAFVMLISLLGLSLCLLAYERHWLYPGINFEALVEANFLLAGLLAIIWQVL